MGLRGPGESAVTVIVATADLVNLTPDSPGSLPSWQVHPRCARRRSAFLAYLQFFVPVLGSAP